MRVIKHVFAAAFAAAAFMAVPAAAGELITVVTVDGPASDILERAVPYLEEKGYDLGIIEASNYLEPNQLLDAGEADADFFQHIPYLYRSNEENGTELVSAGAIYYEPFGIYPGTKTSLDDIAEGDKISIANDSMNQARALLLLQDQGIITLADEAGLAAAKKDIAENPHGVKIQLHDPLQVAGMAGEDAFVVLSAAQAVKAGFSPAADALALEDPDSLGARAYACVLAVRAGEETSDKILALADELRSEEIVSFINDTYESAVLPFTGSDEPVWPGMGEDGIDGEEMTEEDEADANLEGDQEN